jgi:predicted nucleic acid-binding protein
MLKRKRVGIDQAVKAIGIYKQIPIRFVDVELEEALRIANKLDIYAYDAYLIRCAQKYRSPLLTLDRGLQAAAEKASVQVIEV